MYRFLDPDEDQHVVAHQNTYIGGAVSKISTSRTSSKHMLLLTYHIIRRCTILKNTYTDISCPPLSQSQFTQYTYVSPFK